MNAEILSVGTEILLGDIANTDAQMISNGLSELGINVYYHTVVGDNPERLKQAVEIAKGRADILITTGGLGPTYDDLTKETLAECFGKKLILHQPSLDRISEIFARTGRKMAENNKKQAYLPENCTVLENDWGTAPGCAFFEDGRHVIMLPGPPRECTPMFQFRAKPYLMSLSEGIILSHTIKVYGMGESDMEQMLREEIEQMKNPTVAPYAKEGECMLRVTAKADTKEAAEGMLSPVMAHLLERLGEVVYGVDVDSLEQVLVRLLTEKGMTIAAAESCTGGLVTKRLTDIPGASACVQGGVCAYSNEIKERVLGVPPEMLATYGAVSEETAKAMAEGVRALFGADIGVGVTGVAGPDGGSEEKPVGLVYLAVAGPGGTSCEMIRRRGGRGQVRFVAASRALDMARRAVLSAAK